MDGDTVMVLRDGVKIKVRLLNIDAPESDQPYGVESRQALAERILKKQVLISSQAVDSYGRLLADISIDGHSVNEEQVSKGLAWEYSHYHGNKRYVELSRQAQELKRGLWADHQSVIAPSQWRKTHPAKIPSSTPPKANISPVSCGKKHLCSQMLNCAEARIYFLHCGIKSLDGNADGVPCENLCAAEIDALNVNK